MPVRCGWCSNEFVCETWNHIYCSDECRSKMYSKRRNDNTKEINRFLIFQRDGFRCKICGVSAKEGARLHIDHWIPQVKGGKNSENNLITLCASCNMSKSKIIPNVDMDTLL